MSTASTSMTTPAFGPETLQEMAKYGVVRVPVDTFHVGGYRYTNLADAIAQAKRVQSPD